MIGRRDQDRINIFVLEQFSVVQVAFPFANILRSSHPSLIDIRYGHDADVILCRALHQAMNVSRALSATADHSDADSIVGSEGGRRNDAGQRN